MKFDKSKVYTAVNADELKIGRRVILGDSLSELREEVEAEKEAAIQNLTIIHGENMSFRFTGDKYHSGHSLAYLIKPPSEPKYKPFKSVEKAMETIKQHGGWIKSKNGNKSFFITGFNKKENAFCFVFEHWHSFSFLFAKFVWVDDGSPCGELMEA